MNKSFEQSFEDLLEKLIQIQNDMNQSLREDNYTLYRLLELDMYRVLDLLGLNACDYCQYKVLNKNNKCNLEVSCKSYIMIKQISKNNDNLTASFEFQFKLINNEV